MSAPERIDQALADLRTMLADPNRTSAPSSADPRKPNLRAVRKDAASVRPARVTDLYREAHASGDPAQLLRAAILAMAVRYADAASAHGFAWGVGNSAKLRRATRAEKRRRIALERLTAALAALAGGAR